MRISHADFALDVGFYVFSDTTPMPLIGETPDNGSDDAGAGGAYKNSDFYFEETITVTLWNWWWAGHAFTLDCVLIL